MYLPQGIICGIRLLVVVVVVDDDVVVDNVSAANTVVIFLFTYKRISTSSVKMKSRLLHRICLPFH